MRRSVAETRLDLAPGATAPSFRSRLVAWLPAAAWAAFIFSMSTDGMSAEHTRSWIEPLVRFVAPSLSASAVEVIHEALRKVAHVSEYFVFFVMLQHGFRRGTSIPAAAVPASALAVAALYSLTDEAHQLFVASRTASLRDCALDTLGATLAAVSGRFGLPLPR